MIEWSSLPNHSRKKVIEIKIKIHNKAENNTRNFIRSIVIIEITINITIEATANVTLFFVKLRISIIPRIINTEIAN